MNEQFKVAHPNEDVFKKCKIFMRLEITHQR